MTNSLLAIMTLSGYAVFWGYPLANLLPASHRLEKIALALLLGLGLGTWFWYLGFLLGVPFTLPSFLLITLLARVIITLIVKRFLPLSTPLPTPLSRLDKLTIITILTLGFLHLAITTYNPITAWDSLALYDFRGRTIALNHDLTDITSSSYYLSYPLMISLVHSLVYQLGAANPQGFHTILFLAMILIVWGRTRLFTNPLFAALAAVLTLTNYDLFYHASYAYTNIPYTVYLVAGILLLLYPAVPTRSAVTSNLLVGSLLIGISTWVRSSEPFWLLGLLLLLWTGIKAKALLPTLLGILFVLVLRQSWLLYFASALALLPDASTVESQINARFVIGRILTNYLEITWYIILNIIYPYLPGWVGAVFVALSTLRYRTTALLQLAVLILILASMVFAGIAIFSTYYATWTSIGDSARRMMLFLIPLIIISLTLVVHQTLYEKK